MLIHKIRNQEFYKIWAKEAWKLERKFGKLISVLKIKESGFFSQILYVNWNWIDWTKWSGNRGIHYANMGWAFKSSNVLIHGNLYSEIREKQREVTAWEKHFFSWEGMAPGVRSPRSPLSRIEKKKKKVISYQLTRGGRENSRVGYGISYAWNCLIGIACGSGYLKGALTVQRLRDNKGL